MEMLRLFALIFILNNVMALRNVSSAEFLALEALYLAADGDNWPWRFGSTITKWDFSTFDVSKPCGLEWEHVVCDSGCTEASEYCSIVSLHLSGLKMRGFLPGEMSGLQFVTSLDLSSNNLTSMDPGFWNMPALANLDLSHNQIQHTLDESFCNASALLTADFTSNRFRGTFPDCVGKMTNLNSLTLSSNEVEEIFPHVTLFPSLFSLYLNDNKLQGSLPTIVGQLTGLGVLVLSFNKLSGSLPAELGQLTQLLQLDLNDNQFGEEVPAGMCQMSSLQSVKLNDNSLSGSLPTCIGGMDRLNSLVLCHNSLYGAIPSSLADSTSIRTLALDNNKFSQSIPSGLFAGDHLSEVDLSFNKLTGSLPPLTGKSLHVVDLNSNFLRGSVPVVLAASIQDLDMSFNMFDGSVEHAFSAIQVLMQLNLASNQFTGAFPVLSMQAQSTLREIHLRANRFESTVPTWLVNYTMIVELDVSENEFTGPVPVNFFLWQSITCANFSNNYLTGHVPSVFDTNCPEVVYFDISHNHLSGPLSGDLAAALNLFELVVSSNRLTGTIPVCLTGMQLYLLKLDNNYLTGTVPVRFGEMTNIRTLFFYSNMLTGPLDGVFSPVNAHLSVVDFSDNAFTGEVPRSVFKLKELKSISMAKNCFSGEFPVEICEATGLVMLDFDGIRSGAACQRSEFIALSKVTGNHHVYFSPSLAGSIPQCMFNLENITQIFISGNGLVGSIPEIPKYSKITDLALSFNRLRGSIPQSLQEHTKMRSLHLSNNRLCGDVSGMTHFTQLQVPSADNQRPYLSAPEGNEDDDVATYVGLSNNRLSGYLPQEFVHADNVNVLAGNLFMCDSDHSLPRSDPSVGHYFCGSSVLDGAMYTLLGYLVVVLLIVGVWFLFYKYQVADDGTTTKRTKSNPLSFIRNTITMQYSDKHIRESTSVMLCRDDAQWAASMRSSVVEKPSFADAGESDSVVDDARRSLTLAEKALLSEQVKRPSTPAGVGSSADDSSIAYGAERLSSISLGEYDLKCSEMHKLFGLLLTLRLFSIYAALVAVGVFLPAYLILKAEGPGNSTHTYQYGWYPSMAYLQGEESAMTLCVLWSLLLITVVVAVLMMNRPLSKSRNSGSSSSVSASEDESVTADSSCGPVSGARDSFGSLFAKQWSVHIQMYGDFAYLLLATALNCTVLLVVNFGYVYISFNYDVMLTWIVIICLAIFKTAWNVKMIPLLLRQASVFHQDMDISRGHIAVIQSLWIMFNNVVAPVAATLAADSSCYESIFIPVDTIETSYAYPVCQSFNTSNGACLQEEAAFSGSAMPFHPPFIYSLQCSSSLLTKYAPLFLLVYGVTGVILPIAQVVVMETLQKFAAYREEHNYVTFMTTRAGWMLSQNIRHVELLSCGLITPALWPVSVLIEQGYLEPNTPAGVGTEGADSAVDGDSDIAPMSAREAKAALYARTRSLYKFQSVTCNVVASLAVLLTFGIAYPPLAVLIALYICATTSILHRTVFCHLKNCPRTSQSRYRSRSYAKSLQRQQGQRRRQTRALDSAMSSNPSTTPVISESLKDSPTPGIAPSVSASSLCTVAMSGRESTASGISNGNGNGNSRNSDGLMSLSQPRHYYLDSLIFRVKKESNGLLHVLYKSIGCLLVFIVLFVVSFMIDMQEGYECAWVLILLGVALLVVLYCLQPALDLFFPTSRRSGMTSDDFLKSSLLTDEDDRRGLLDGDDEIEGDSFVGGAVSDLNAAMGASKADLYADFDYAGRDSTLDEI